MNPTGRSVCIVKEGEKNSARDDEMNKGDESTIRSAGMIAVREWLERNGWKVIDEVSLTDDDMDEIEAIKNHDSVMISIKSSIYPTDPGFLTDEQRVSLHKLALTKGIDLRFARVWLNDDLSLKDGNVMWSHV